MNRLRPALPKDGWAIRAMAGEGGTDELPMSPGLQTAKLSMLIAYAQPLNRLFQRPGSVDESPTILAVIHADRLRKPI
jgi:hypothetical protein